jgi:uncharacterized protein YbjT (DUF2867 family)
VLGIELAGVVEAVRTDASRSCVGARVMGPLGGLGAYTDFVIVDEGKLVRTPQGFGRRYVRSLARTTSSNTGPPTLRVDRAGHRSRARLLVGDLTDVASLRAAMSPVRTLFLLNAVTPDEVTQALVALNLAREAGIERVVYLSVIHSDKFTNVPHFTGKHTVERMIESLDIPATILRPAYFMQNERLVQQVIQGYGLYPMPIGSTGVAMIDARDIADIAVAELPRSVAKSLTAETTWRPSKDRWPRWRRPGLPTTCA